MVTLFSPKLRPFDFQDHEGDEGQYLKQPWPERQHIVGDAAATIQPEPGDPQALQQAASPALLGVVFVVQMPSRQPEVVFKRILPSVAREERDAKTKSEEEGSPAGLPPNQFNLGLPQLSGGSIEDLKQELHKCFGIPGMIFAKLMLPDEELSNRPFYLEIDAGRRQTTQQHGAWSHLLFVSFPCNVEQFARADYEVRGLESIPPKERVQRFNTIHVLDSRLADRREKSTSTLWQVSAHIARALVSEEGRCGYLSSEIKRLACVPPWEALDREVEDHPTFPEPCGLDRLLTEMFDGMYHKGYESLIVNGSILCQVSVFPKLAAPVPSKGHALALNASRRVLLQELPPDAADIVRKVVEAIDPSKTLGELMVALALPLGTLQRVAEHLVYWKKARIVEAFTPEKRVVVAPGLSSTSKFAKEFQDWHTENRVSSRGAPLTFSEVLAAFSGGRTLKEISENFRKEKAADFHHVLEWLVTRCLLMQLTTYIHFLPNKRARDDYRAPKSVCHVGLEIRTMFCPHVVNEDELKILAGRSENSRELKFFCRFIAEFVRPHVRVDGCKFEAMFKSADRMPRNHKHDLTRKEAEDLLHANSDIFVPYICRQ